VQNESGDEMMQRASRHSDAGYSRIWKSIVLRSEHISAFFLSRYVLAVLS
jgi:hypothetical protein